MMEGSQSVLNPAILEISNTEETIPDAEEPNYGLSEEYENQDNDQQESGIINQEGEPSLNPSTKASAKENLASSRKQSQRSSHLPQSHRQSVGRQSLPTTMPHQLQPSSDAASTKGSVVWLSQRTGKEMKSKFNQTSFIWERKPLAEILHPSSKTPKTSKGTEKSEAGAREFKDTEKAEADAGESKDIEKAEADDTESKDTEKAETDDRETVTPVQDTETEQNAMQESAHSMQPLEETDDQGGTPSPVQLEEQASQHGSERTIVSQHIQEQTLSPAQPPNEAMMEGDIKVISKKTGKEMKYGFNQTSFIWERKPLAEILGPRSTKTRSPGKYTPPPEVGEQVEEPQLQHDNQQLDGLKSTQGGGQEAPEETPAALGKVPEAPEEALDDPEGTSRDALLAPVEASGAPEEAPEAAPES